MDFSLNDHQKLIRDTVRQFMEAEVRPSVKEMEKAEKFPADAVRKLGEMGCCGVLTPESGWAGARYGFVCTDHGGSSACSRRCPRQWA
jgi:alkylation response protein AidB-like acyl-CoA dehydrogenase